MSVFDKYFGHLAQRVTSDTVRETASQELTKLANAGVNHYVHLRQQNFRYRRALERIAAPEIEAGLATPEKVWQHLVDIAHEALEDVE